MRRKSKTEPEGTAGAQIAALTRRVVALEDEVQECRMVNRRLAEVVDVVSELLVPAMDRDDAKVAAALARLS
ncbi:DUF6752 domain-containing protein [Nocardioides sp. Root151]|uniref:DUF6752 domain-containing protein n=1 Tax=Nocardioides sp. Root151 TaxID=1736475 RepID=UPI000703B3D2|nr:DUF6752 domain-containing protein [Nocardioides sp. Root151]KQZ67070.1 hypothetical protein ASD66_18940 [Nocardioides sp. Root151]